MRRNRKAKIIVTLGPSTSNFKSVKKLFDNGADVFRLNFSHDTKETHIKRFKDIRNLEKKVNKPIGILMDLQGPKFRVGKFEENSVFLKQGKKFVFDSNPFPGNKFRVNLPHEEIFKKIKKGNKILIDDKTQIALNQDEKTPDKLKEAKLTEISFAAKILYW